MFKPFLTISNDAANSFSAEDTVPAVWSVFSKCKHAVHEGHRLENLAWRWWYKQLAESNYSLDLDPGRPPPLVQSSDSSEEPESDAGPPSDWDQADGRKSRRSFLPSLSLSTTTTTTIPACDRSDPAQCKLRRPSVLTGFRQPSLGEIILRIIPDSPLEFNSADGGATTVKNSPTVERPHVLWRDSTSTLASEPTDALSTREILNHPIMLEAPQVRLPSPSSLTTTIPNTPTVVVVNPTPHPTPPATPILPPKSDDSTDLKSLSPTRTQSPSSGDSHLNPSSAASSKMFFLSNSETTISSPTTTESTESCNSSTPVPPETTAAASPVPTHGAGPPIHPARKASADSSAVSASVSSSGTRAKPVTRRSKEARHHAGVTLRRTNSSKARHSGPTTHSSSTGAATRHASARKSSAADGATARSSSKSARRKSGPSSTTALVASPQKMRRIEVVNSSDDYETLTSDSWDTDDEDDSEVELSRPAATKSGKAPVNGHTQQHTRGQSEEEPQITSQSNPATELAPDGFPKDMFKKLPPRSYSNLGRTRSGLLSEMFNPDPRKFPADHPFIRVKSMESGIPPSSRPHMLNRPTMTGLMPSVARPVASQVTAQVEVLSSVATRNADGPSASGAYRPRGPPQDAEMDDSSSDEHDNKVQLSQSLAQRRLENLRRRGNSNPESAQLPELELTPHHSTSGAPTMPIDVSMFAYAHALPTPQPPATPRTVRRNMLTNEFSESVRRQLLWERAIAKRNGLGPPRRQLLLKPASLNELLPAPDPTAVTRELSTSDEDREREKRRSRAAKLVQNRSEFHNAGW